MRKNVFAAALILALGVGSFAACSSDDVVTPQHGTETLGGTTFMTVKFAIPQGNSQRSHDYNFVGLWSGRDDVQGYKAYIFDGTTGTSTLEAVQVLTSSDFSQAASGNNYVITPTKAVRVKPGNKVVYVVVNPNTETDALLPAVLSTTTLNQFKAAYESKNLATAGVGVYTSTIMGSPAKTSADVVAKTITSAGNVKDVIVMTGEPAGVATIFNVADGVTEAQATATVSPQNQAEVNVKRTVARVVVTSSDDSFTLLGDDPYTPGTVETNYQIGEVKGFRFVTAQSERELFLQQGKDAANTSTNDAWNSPALAQNATDDYGDPTTSQPAAILKAYDYTNLWKNRANANVLGGNEVHKVNPATPGHWTEQEIGQMAYDCDFVLPTTHKFVAIAPNAPYEYRKGNTAYVLVRTAFVPKDIQVGSDYMTGNPAIAAAMTTGNLAGYITAMQAAVPAGVVFDPTTGAVTTPVSKVAFSTITSGSEPDYLYYGVGTHKFYTSEFASQDPVFQGSAGQPVQKFKKVLDPVTNNFLGYKMLYFAWVNPDANPEWYNSPVYRNNIYHVEIDGIGGLGENWNPLVPATPNPGGVPSNDPNHPNNPDPFLPNGPVTLPVPPVGNTPVTPTPTTPPVTPVTPIKPSDPLTQKKTHMSVKVTVLPWQVHSYKYILKN